MSQVDSGSAPLPALNFLSFFIFGFGHFYSDRIGFHSANPKIGTELFSLLPKSPKASCSCLEPETREKLIVVFQMDQLAAQTVGKTKEAPLKRRPNLIPCLDWSPKICQSYLGCQGFRRRFWSTAQP
jgi:hypothetical protein